MADENPFERLIPSLDELPEIFLAPNNFPGPMAAWVPRRATDLQTIYLDTEHFSAKDLAIWARLIGDSWRQVPLEIDPPMHGVYRQMLNPCFAPRRMAALEDRVRQLARSYIDKFKDRGECEFMGEFAFRFPIAVILEMMGLPMSRVEEFLRWMYELTYSPDLDKMAETVRALKSYLLSEIDERRRHPRDDLISFAVAAEVEGGRKLDVDELLGLCINLFAAGMGTVSANFGNLYRHLAEHPEHQNLLRKNPDRIPAALEELLRAYAAVSSFRTCTKPVMIGRVQMMPGDKVMMSTTLLNRDPELFEAPHEVRLDRNPHHLTFGSGIHRCVGAPLARRELTIALEEMLRAIPEFRVAPGAKIRTHLWGTIQPDQLPLVW